jgi:hypothetical protein
MPGRCTNISKSRVSWLIEDVILVIFVLLGWRLATTHPKIHQCSSASHIWTFNFSINNPHFCFGRLSLRNLWCSFSCMYQALNSGNQGAKCVIWYTIPVPWYLDSTFTVLFVDRSVWYDDEMCVRVWVYVCACVCVCVCVSVCESIPVEQ